MLESLAPSRWDIFEADIKAVVKAMRANLLAQDAAPTNVMAEGRSAEAFAEETDNVPEHVNEDDAVSQSSKIDVMSEAADATETDVAVNLVKPTKKKKPSRKEKSRSQMGKKAVRIDISGESDEPQKEADEDDAAAADGSFKIPIDPE